MADNMTEPSDDEKFMALHGLLLQAEAHELDLSDPNLEAFIYHVAKVKAQMFANERFLTNIIHMRRMN